jgi:type IV secretion system protein TrbF
MNDMKNDGVDSPFLSAKKTHNDTLLKAMMSARTQSLYGALGFLVAVVAVGGLTYVGSQSKFVPIVYEIDKYHNVLSATKADQVADPRPIDYEVAAEAFIGVLRLVTLDFDMQRKASTSIFAYVQPNSPAQTKIQELLGPPTAKYNPFNRSKDEIVSADDIMVIKLADLSYQVDWTETVRITETGEIKETPYKMRAILTFAKFDKSAKSSIIDEVKFNNPYSIFVQDININRMDH